MSQNLQTIAKFQKIQLENLVDFEKCCKTHILLQKSEPIQPKTSNILPSVLVAERTRGISGVLQVLYKEGGLGGFYRGVHMRMLMSTLEGCFLRPLS